MTNSNTALLALPPGTDAETLVPQAAAWAQRFGLKLDLCSVLPAAVAADPLHMSGTVQAASEDMVADQKRILDWLSDWMGEVPEAIQGECRVLLGDAVRELKRAAEGHTLLVVGTHHRRDIARLLLGSVAEQLVSESPVPVLVLGTQPRPLHDPPRVHLPIDPAEPNFHAVEWVQSHLDAGDLTAMYLLPFMQTFGPMQPAGEIAMNEARERLRVALVDGGHADLAPLVVVREEINVGDGIANEASTGKVDLIAMPTHGHTGFSRLLFGSVSERVVRGADCAVLVVR